MPSGKGYLTFWADLFNLMSLEFRVDYSFRKHYVQKRDKLIRSNISVSYSVVLEMREKTSTTIFFYKWPD